jgi:uncharacterized delta-60 repeat protein
MTSRIRTLTLIILQLLVLSLSANAAGEVDPTFAASAYGGLTNQGSVYVVKELPDGKILIGGDFTEVQGYAASGLARLNADGSVDTSFNGPDFYSTLGLGRAIYAIAIQSDGKILVGGQIHGAGDTTPGIRRLNTDGSIDQSFFVTPLSFSSSLGGPGVYDIELQTDGKIVIGGVFSLPSGEDIGRFNADGTRDVTFSGNASGVTVKDIAITSDGKIMVGGAICCGPSIALYKLNSNGAQDPSFSPTESGIGSIEAVKVLADGKTVVAGTFTNFRGFPQGRISRINTDGSVDLNFNLEWYRSQRHYQRHRASVRWKDPDRRGLQQLQCDAAASFRSTHCRRLVG